MKTPTEADFATPSVSPSEVVVTFEPTESEYTYTRAPSGELSSPLPRTIRHAATGDTDGNPESEVQSLAYRIAARAAMAAPPPK